MKQEELMIGDWVLYAELDYPVRITGLGEEADVFWHDEDNTTHEPYFKLSPIDLTDEILKANGFVLLEVGDHGAATPAQYRDRFEKWMLHTKWQDVILWYDRRTEKYNLHDMNGAKLQFVHELQHALRLAGIDFDIKL